MAQYHFNYTYYIIYYILFMMCLLNNHREAKQRTF